MWLYESPVEYILDKSIVFVVLDTAKRDFRRRYVNLETAEQGFFLKDSRLHKFSKRIA